MRPTLLIIALAATGPAVAFVPDGPVVPPAKFADVTATVPGTALVHGDRPVRTTHIGQARARQADRWQTFEAGVGHGWTATFDEMTGSPLRMWGPPIPLADTSSRQAVVASLVDFVDNHAATFGVTPDDLELISAEFVATMDVWYVDFAVLSGGVPVHDSRVTFRVRGGAISLAGARTYPGLVAPSYPSLRPQTAVERAIAGGRAPLAAHQDIAVEPVVVPMWQPGGLELRPAWQTQTRSESPRGLWRTLVDGETGHVLAVYNELPHVSGQLDGEHVERTVDGSDLVLSALPNAYVTDGGAAGYTDADGVWDLPDAESAVANLQGRFFRVTNEQGPNASMDLTGGADVMDATSASTAEISAYVFAHHVRDWAQNAAPEVNMGRLHIRVNHAGQCNAWYDPQVHSINFLRRGSDCNNTAMVADIVYHEWGHGFHGRSVAAGTVDASMGEGISDVVSVLQTGDPRVGPYFLRDGREVRNVAPDAVYPDDYTPSADYVHYNGLIFAGAMWDLWGDLVTLHGAEEGTRRLEDIFTGLLKGGPSLTTAYAEAIFADDNDNDLTNGTPNQCEIFDAFQRHGLGPLGSSGAAVFQFTRPDAANANEPYDVSGNLVDLLPACGTVSAGEAYVTWRADGGDWQQTELDIEGGDVTGAIPPQQTGTLVEYVITIEDTDGGRIEAPGDGLVHPYSYYVGGVLEIFCTDFEDSDEGFTSALLAGTEQEGANDWMWGVPHGRGGDPTQAASGTRVWGNDLGEEGWDGQYQNSKHTRLETPPIDTAHYTGTFLHYQRWLHVEDGFWDQARITADDDVVWSNWATDRNNGVEHHMEQEWQGHAVNLGPAGEDGTVVIGWEIESDEGLSFGGWTLDDVCVFAPATADNRLAVLDAAAEETGRRDVRVTWTNPVHGPLASVTIVRSVGTPPTGPTDGTVVAVLTDVEIGAAMELADSDVPRREDLWYTVFPSDGEESLSWAVDGRNAARIRLGGGSSNFDEEGVGVACGCQTPAAPVAGWMLLGALGLFTRRRR